MIIMNDDDGDDGDQCKNLMFVVGCCCDLRFL